MKTSRFPKTEGKIRMYAAMPLISGVPMPMKRMEPAEVYEGEEDIESGDRMSFRDDRGIGTVEMILLLVVLIALVAIFKTQLTSLVKTILARITTNANSVMR